MNNILDYVKPLVDEIYSREPDFDNDIIVQPDKIIIRKNGRYPENDTIRLTNNNQFNIVTDSDDFIIEVERETIEQVIDFVLE